jgi:hypothetical protein
VSPRAVGGPSGIGQGLGPPVTALARRHVGAHEFAAPGAASGGSGDPAERAIAKREQQWHGDRVTVDRLLFEMPNFADGKIEAYVGPPRLGGADDLEAVIVECMAGARRKLDVAVQELDSDAIAKAILAASWRGVRVTLFLEQDYLRTSLKRDTITHVPIPPVPKSGETEEQALERVQWQKDDTRPAREPSHTRRPPSLRRRGPRRL